MLMFDINYSDFTTFVGTVSMLSFMTIASSLYPAVAKRLPKMILKWQGSRCGTLVGAVDSNTRSPRV